MLYWETGQLLPFIDKSNAMLPNNGAFAAATTRKKKRGGGGVETPGAKGHAVK